MLGCGVAGRAASPGSFVSWARGKSQDDGEDSFCRGKICRAEGLAFLVRIRQIIALPLDLPPSPKGEGLKGWRNIEMCGASRPDPS